MRLLFLFSFLFISILLNATELITPLNNSTFDKSNQIDFSWSFTNQNDSFVFQLSSDSMFSILIVNDTLPNSDFSISSLGNLVYYWRVGEIDNNSIFWSEKRVFKVIDLVSINQIKGWYHTDNGMVVSNGKLFQWNDLSGNNNNFIQLDTNRLALVIDSILDKNVVYFNGIDNRYACNTLIPNQPTSFFLVMKSLTLTSNQFYFDGIPVNTMRFSSSNVGRYVLFSGSFVTGAVAGVGSDFNIVNNLFNGVNSYIRKDFQFQIENNVGNNSPSSGFVIGSQGGLNQTNPNNHSEFYLAELIIIDDTVSLQQTIDIEQYLRYKYAPPVSLGADLNLSYGFCDIELRPLRQIYKTYTWSTGETTPTITVSNSGTYWVQVEDQFGFTSSDTVVVIDNRSQILLPTQNIICFGDSLTWNTNLNSNDYSFNWNNGLSTDSLLTIFQDGAFYLSITDTNNCVFQSDTFVVSIDSFQFNSTLDDSLFLCSGNIILPYFNQDISQYLWSNNSQDSFYVAQITEEITLQTVNLNGCTNIDSSFLIVVGITPTVDFESALACENAEVQLTDLSLSPSSNIISWQWDFGNDSTSVTQNSTTIYQNQGTYNVQLTVGTDDGCTNFATKQIVVYPQPNAGFQNQIICAENNAIFTDISFVANPSTIQSWQWDFGNGDFSNNQNGTTNFDADGVYQVSLTVTTNFGCVSTNTRAIEVFPALLPNFEVSNLCLSDSVQFTETTSSFSVVDRLWNFGFPTEFSTQQNPKYLYNQAGTYNVTLNVENAIGCTNSITKPIEIFEPPMFSILNDTACIEENLRIWYNGNFSTNDTVLNTFWQVDTNVFENIDTIQFFLGQDNQVEVLLNISTQSGCTVSESKTISVYSKPTVNFNFTPTYGTAPIDIQFENTSLDLVAYVWSFGDNSDEVFDENPIHSYQENGQYTVSFTGFNQEGCSNSLQKTIPLVPSELDIEVRNLNLQIEDLGNGNFKVTTSVVLFNNGSRLIENADLNLKLDGQVGVVETWNGLLNVGNSVVYTFNAFYEISNMYDAQRICVEAKNVNDNTEINLENNRACSLVNGLFSLSNPYPNPTSNTINLDLITAEAGTAEIWLYSVDGKALWENPNFNLLKGINKLSLNIEKFASGKYFFKVIYLNDNYVVPFAISID